MKGYKVFNPNFQCRGFQFEVGKTYKHEGYIKLCRSGFHFCTKPSDCFTYYDLDPDNIVCEIEAEGVSEEISDDSKRVCSIITIVRRLEWSEVLQICNTGKGNSGINNSGNFNSGSYNSGSNNSGSHNSGNFNSGFNNSGFYNSGFNNLGHYNSGEHNSGNFNSGNHNSGYRNSGDKNSGYRNSGEGNSGIYNSGHYNSGNYNVGRYNSCNYSSGFFCSKTPKIFAFNKEIDISYLEYACLIPFIKLDHTLPYKESWKKWWNEAGEENQQKIKNLPGFDSEVFKEITGIEI